MHVRFHGSGAPTFARNALHLSLQLLSYFRHILSCAGVDVWFPVASVSSLCPCTEHMPYAPAALCGGLL